MLIPPWTDLEAADGSLDYNAGNDAIFTKEWIAAMAAGFLNGHDPRDPAAGPLHADLGRSRSWASASRRPGPSTLRSLRLSGRPRTGTTTGLEGVPDDSKTPRQAKT
jgi:hypothetical protein